MSVRDDRGSIGIAAVVLLVMALAGATLIFDGGRALSARRHIVGIADGAARAGVATAGPNGLDEAVAVDAAQAHVLAAGVAPGDIRSISATRTEVVVELQATTAGTFTALLGNDTITVTGSGSAQLNYQEQLP